MIQNQITNRLEQFYLDLGYDCVIGVDEVGRGSWAGPVVVGAFVYERSSQLIENVNDSKKLTPKKRITLSSKLEKQNYFLAQSSVEEIDRMNILEATRLAIKRVISKIESKKMIVLIDGHFKLSFDFEYKCLVKGDAKHYSIAAASILAKVYRDNLMVDMAKLYPHYGFETNVGYGTKKHRLGLEKYGVCDIHRHSYAPIKRILNSANKYAS